MIACTCGSTTFSAQNVEILVSVHIENGDTVSMDLCALKPGKLTVECENCGAQRTTTLQDSLRDIGTDVTPLAGLQAARQLMLNAMYEVDEIVALKG